MNGLLIKVIIGFTYKILWLRKSIFVQCDICNVTFINDLLTANCSSRSLSDVPQYLDRRIQTLILSNNTFEHLNESSFARYKDLKTLSLANTVFLNDTNPIDYYTFRPLKKLEVIIFDEIYTPFNFTLHWPPNVKVVSVNRNPYISNLDFSPLKKLQDVYAVTRTVRAFPKFHILSPLTFLDFRTNPMDSLTAEDLAPFCNLNFLSLEWPAHAIINSSERYCQCQRLENWMILAKIGMNGPLNCTAPVNLEADFCNWEYSEETLRIRKDCMGRLFKPAFIHWIVLAVGVLLVVPFVIMAFFDVGSCRRCFRRGTATRKVSKYPNVKLKINVDEDFEYEEELGDEQEFEEDEKASPSTEKPKEKVKRNELVKIETTTGTTPASQPTKTAITKEKSPSSKSVDKSPDNSSSVDTTKKLDSNESTKKSLTTIRTIPLKDDKATSPKPEEKSSKMYKSEKLLYSQKNKEFDKTQSDVTKSELVRKIDEKGVSKCISPVKANRSPKISESPVLAQYNSPRNENSEKYSTNYHRPTTSKYQSSSHGTPTRSRYHSSEISSQTEPYSPRYRSPVSHSRSSEQDDYKSPRSSRYAYDLQRTSFNENSENMDQPEMRRESFTSFESSPLRKVSQGTLFNEPINSECYLPKEYDEVDGFSELHYSARESSSTSSQNLRKTDEEK